mmetsp:Transcript_35640/g.84119  ORF Transcript_35640/g.84119 Transcript_35640/m.84119 type:complete len:269 (-) Transcript_35640:1255-2061(-)
MIPAGCRRRRAASITWLTRWTTRPWPGRPSTGRPSTPTSRCKTSSTPTYYPSRRAWRRARSLGSCARTMKSTASPHAPTAGCSLLWRARRGASMGTSLPTATPTPTCTTRTTTPRPRRRRCATCCARALTWTARPSSVSMRRARSTRSSSRWPISRRASPSSSVCACGCSTSTRPARCRRSRPPRSAPTTPRPWHGRASPKAPRCSRTQSGSTRRRRCRSLPPSCARWPCSVLTPTSPRRWPATTAATRAAASSPTWSTPSPPPAASQ